MQKLISLLTILVFVSSCKTKKPETPDRDGKNNFAIDAAHTFSVISNFDTIFDPNAPKRITRNIKLDKQGNLLIAAYDDIIRYDGNTFTEIKSDNDRSFINVWSIIEDKANNIWLVDSSGLWQYRDDAFIHALEDVWKVFVDFKGDLWFTGMLNAGASTLNRIEGNISTNKDLGVTEVSKSEKMFFGIVEDKKGRKWIGGGDGIWVYDGVKVDYYTGKMEK